MALVVSKPLSFVFQLLEQFFLQKCVVVVVVEITLAQSNSDHPSIFRTYFYIWSDLG
jgi:hypothetical protein